MPIPATGTNSPPYRPTRRALAEQNRRVARYMGEGMTRKAATARAIQEMRDNQRRDWRRSAKPASDL
jgi:hypothetical protein